MLFPGDSLRAGNDSKAGNGEVRLAICPALAVETLASGGTRVLPDSAATTGCDLPETAPPDQVSVRGGEESKLASGCTGEGAGLLEELHAAAQARARGDNKTAAAAYGRIACAWPAAGWARGIVTRVAELEDNSAAGAARGETWALLIGISTYSDKTPQGSLAYAAADALAFRMFLRQPRGGSVPEDHILLLTNEKATRAAIDSAIDTFVHDARKKQNTLIVFIAGHGDYLTSRKDPDTQVEIHEDPFFITYDSYLQDVKTTGFPMSKIRDFIADQAQGFARVIAYVDICHAGYTAHVGEPSARDLPAAVKKVFLAKQGSLGVLMATKPDPDAFAFESPTFGGGHGAFTYAVLSSLLGATARPGHKELSLASLFGGMTGNIVYLTNGAQVPDEFATDPQMSVLDDVTVKSDFTLGEATPLSENVTRRRGGRASAQVERATPASPPAAQNEPDAFAAVLADDPLKAARSMAAEAPSLPPETFRDRSRQLRVALEDRGQQILVRYMLGEQTAMSRADFELCASYFGAALALAPLSVFDESRALFCQGRAAIFDKTPQSYQRAIGLIEQSIQLDPEHAYAYNALGIAYLEQVGADAAYYDRAVAAFRDAIRFAPRWVYPLHNLALTWSERGDFPAAAQTYMQAIALAKYYSYLPYNLGLLNQNVNRLDDAEKFYRKAIDVATEARSMGVEPATPRWRERAVAWNALATVEMARRRYSRALDDITKALADDDTLGAAKHNRALLLSRNGASPEAERLWRENIAADSQQNVVSRLALAEYLDRTDRSDQALSECAELLSVARDDVECHRLTGTILMRNDKPAEALPHLDFVRSRLLADGAANEAWADAAARLKIFGYAEGYQRALSAYTDARDRRRVRQKLASLNAGPHPTASR